jgi:hypothetical protein
MNDIYKVWADFINMFKWGNINLYPSPSIFELRIVNNPNPIKTNGRMI